MQQGGDSRNDDGEKAGCSSRNVDDHEPPTSMFQNEELIPYEQAKVGTWVLVNYEGGKFIGEGKRGDESELSVKAIRHKSVPGL